MLGKTRFLRCIPVLALLILPACAVLPVPIPHIDTTVPSVEGHLTENGIPAANKTVIFNWQRDEKGWRYTAETTTAEDGSFSFPRECRLHLIELIVAVADCGYKYQFALKEPETEEPLAVGMFFGPCFGMPEHLTVNCNLSGQEEPSCQFSKTPPFFNMTGWE